jgi:hypothetical protein
LTGMSRREYMYIYIFYTRRTNSRALDTSKKYRYRRVKEIGSQYTR